MVLLTFQYTRNTFFCFFFPLSLSLSLHILCARWKKNFNAILCIAYILIFDAIYTYSNHGHSLTHTSTIKLVICFFSSQNSLRKQQKKNKFQLKKWPKQQIKKWDKYFLCNLNGGLADMIYDFFFFLHLSWHSFHTTFSIQTHAHNLYFDHFATCIKLGSKIIW